MSNISSSLSSLSHVGFLPRSEKWVIGMPCGSMRRRCVSREEHERLGRMWTRPTAIATSIAIEDEDTRRQLTLVGKHYRLAV
jgi:hypothetical protein